MAYDKVLWRQGKKLLYTELLELQQIAQNHSEDIFTALKNTKKGTVSLSYTGATNELTISTEFFVVGRLFKITNAVLSNLFGTTSDSTRTVYAEVSEQVITGYDDSSILHPTLGVRTADRIQYNVVLKSTSSSTPSDVTGQEPGNNKYFVSILQATGSTTTVPTVNEDAYPLAKNRDAIEVQNNLNETNTSLQSQIDKILSVSNSKPTTALWVDVSDLTT